ncbi:MAG: general secretion pathway protein GspK [Gemmatimonadales bacterium]|nr:general secretion pathway protein GspK [Gemmatimonadales bacterium]
MSNPLRRPGFTMLSVLWLLALAGGITLGALAESRVAIDASRHRVTKQRGAWEARGCLAELRATLDRAIRDVSSSEQRLRWRTLDEFAVATNTRRFDCMTQVVPVGLRVDINAAESDEVLRLLRAAGVGGNAPELAGAIHARRNVSDGRSAQGPAIDRLQLQGPELQRTRPFESDAELRLIPGLEQDVAVTVYLGVESGRVSLMHAPAPVLQSLPGFSDDAVLYLLALRQSPRSVGSLQDVVAAAPSSARARLMAAFEQLSLRATLDPDGWRLIATVRDSRTGGRTTVEQEVRRQSDGLLLARESTW